MLVLVLGWTQCLPQGVGASPKNWAAGPPERRGWWIQFAQCSPRLWHCGALTTSRLYPFGALVCHQYDVYENYVGSVYIGGYGGLSESGNCVFR